MSAFSVPSSCWARLSAARVERFGLRGLVRKDVAFAGPAVAAVLQGDEDAGFLQHPVDLAGRAGNDQMQALFPHEEDQVLQRHHAGGVEMAGVLQAQDDHLDRRIGDGALDLRAEQFRRAEEQVALDVDDRDRRDRPLALLAHFAQFAGLAELILDQIGPARLAQEEHDGNRHADENRHVQRRQQGGDEGDDQHRRVIGGRAQADPDVAEVEQRERQRDHQRRQRRPWARSRSVARPTRPRRRSGPRRPWCKRRKTTRRTACARRIRGSASSGSASPRRASRRRRRLATLAMPTDEHVLVHVRPVAGLRGEGFRHQGVFQRREEGEGEGDAQQRRDVRENLRRAPSAAS